MKKRIIAALMASLASMVLASAASAATITQAPAGPGYQNLNPFPNSSGVCGGNGGTYSLSGNPIRLTFGWGAHTTSQMTGFFKNSHGSVTITGTNDTFSDSWANSPSGSPFVSQQGIAWSALTPVTLQAPGSSGQTLSGYNSQYRGVLTIAAGTYTLTQTYVFDKPVQDGFASYSKPLTSTCTFTVVP
jgi:hypothetical protein